MTPTQDRILARWNGRLNGSNGKNGHRRLPLLHFPKGQTLLGGGTSASEDSIVTYPASSVTDSTFDFRGEWRSADSWMRFDLWRVRNRSRQVAVGNAAMIAFRRNMRNNVFGHKGFRFDPNVRTGARFGDKTEDEPDALANTLIKSLYEEFGRKENMTTRQKLSRREVDDLLLDGLIVDGEFILIKQRGYEFNDFNFSWKIVNPDYLDHNLNRIEAKGSAPGIQDGDITKMGITFDKTYKFPKIYWFLRRRPNDFLYNYNDNFQDRYIPIPANQVIHVFEPIIDDEQTRGFPWIFAALTLLFRAEKYIEAALINAAIGASKGVFFEKQYPQGFTGDPRELSDDDKGQIVAEMSPGLGYELPWGVKPNAIDLRYPDDQIEGFLRAMNLSLSQVFGTSYATSTHDLSQSNFVSSRMGQLEERELYKAVQEFLIEKWKQPGFDEELYRSILAKKINLPIGNFDKFNRPEFTGRRWQFVQPVDEWKATELKLNNLVCTIGDIIKETSQDDPEEVFQRISDENKLLKKYNLARITSAKSESVGTEQPQVPGTGSAPESPSKPNPSTP